MHRFGPFQLLRKYPHKFLPPPRVTNNPFANDPYLDFVTEFLGRQLVHYRIVVVIADEVKAQVKTTLLTSTYV